MRSVLAFGVAAVLLAGCGGAEDPTQRFARGATEARLAANTLPDDVTNNIAMFRKVMTDKLSQRLGWQPRCKPTVLRSGRIVLPLYSDTYSVSLMALSDDQGETWFSSRPLAGFGNIQPAV